MPYALVLIGTSFITIRASLLESRNMPQLSDRTPGRLLDLHHPGTLQILFVWSTSFPLVQIDSGSCVSSSCSKKKNSGEVEGDCHSLCKQCLSSWEVSIVEVPACASDETIVTQSTSISQRLPTSAHIDLHT